jgi:hypothetical protein
MSRFILALALIVMTSCSQRVDSELVKARSIRDDVCRCDDRDCYQETATRLWTPFSTQVQQWSKTASIAEKTEMEQIDRDIRGLCEARSRFSNLEVTELGSAP